MADHETCKFGCRSLPCIHNKWAEKKKDDSPKRELPGMYRPRVINYNGKQIMLASENLHTGTRPPYVQASEDTTTTSYVSDGNNFNYAMSVQRKWITNKVEAIANTFPEHLRNLVKEMRGLK